ncbi:MAG: hypothetical protein ACFE85_12160 [Candidatus Hodarchaeota archaeon]
MDNYNTDLLIEDEYLHKPSRQLKWRESYYFNWVDIENQISGFSTIGIVPNEKRREFVFLLFLKDRNEVYYREPFLYKYENNIEIMLQDKKLVYRLIKPFESWQIEYKSHKLTFELSFQHRFPVYSFGLDSSKSWHQHFEASGIISGILKFRDGTMTNISGYGQRDKSWGYRDWHQFDKWFAGHFQFKDWSCTFRKDYSMSQIDLSGHISNKDENIPISQLEIITIKDNDQFNSPLISTYQIKDKKGRSYVIKAKRIKKNSFIRFAKPFTRGYTELFEQMVIIENLDSREIGSGMMEHLRTKIIN